MKRISKKNKRILGCICGMMILFGLMFMILMFITPWGVWLDIHSSIGDWFDLPVWFSRAALKAYWLIVVVLLLAFLYYPEE